MVLLLTGISIASTVEIYTSQDMIKKSQSCLDCHEDKSASLSGTVHQLSRTTDLNSPVTVGCIGCHDGWEAHLEEPSRETVADPRSYSAVDLAEVCSRCHTTAHQAAMISTNPHNRTDVNCLSCHTIHRMNEAKTGRDDMPDKCLSCHTGVAAEFNARSAHPLASGNISCIDCHSLEGTKDPELAVGLDWTCQSCHSDKAGPFVHEHPVAYTHLVNGGGCTECHRPHGSPNDRLLNQPGNGTCLQCHGTPPGHRIEHSGLGTKLACVDCHTDIHGSYDNRFFLDPDLGTKLFPDCYQSGCHIMNR